MSEHKPSDEFDDADLLHDRVIALGAQLVVSEAGAAALREVLARNEWVSVETDEGSTPPVCPECDAYANHRWSKGVDSELLSDEHAEGCAMKRALSADAGQEMVGRLRRMQLQMAVMEATLAHEQPKDLAALKEAVSRDVMRQTALQRKEQLEASTRFVRAQLDETRKALREAISAALDEAPPLDLDIERWKKLAGEEPVLSAPGASPETPHPPPSPRNTPPD